MFLCSFAGRWGGGGGGLSFFLKLHVEGSYLSSFTCKGVNIFCLA